MKNPDQQEANKRMRAKKRHRGNGEGSVYPCPGGGFRAALTVAWKTNKHGKRVPVRKFFRGKTAQEVMDKRDQERQKLRAGQVCLAPEKQTVEHFMTAWLKAVTPPIIEQNTYDQYEYLTRLHINPVLGAIPLKKLHRQQVQEFLAGRLNSVSETTGRQFSVTTCRHMRTCLRTALNYAVENKLISENPAIGRTVRLPKDEHKVRFMTTQELGAFRAAARGNWMENAFTLSLSTGICLSEVLGLQWCRIDLEKREMRIEYQLQRNKVTGKLFLKKLKTKNRRRVLKLPQDAVDALIAQKMQQHREMKAAEDTWKNSDFVFTNRETGQPMDKHTLHDYFCEARDAAGITGLTFHGLRHTYASVLLSRKVPIKQISENLGHADVAFTLRTYAHCMPELRDEAATAIDVAFARAHGHQIAQAG